MKKEDLTKIGFVLDAESQSYTKTEKGKTVRCFQHPKGAGYWVCQIDPTSPAQNTRITSIDDVKDFIKATCPEDRVEMGIILDANNGISYKVVKVDIPEMEKML